MIADLTLAPASGGKATVYIASDEAEAHKLTPDGEQVWAYAGHSEFVYGVAVDADGFVYTASADGEQGWAYTGHTNRVEGVAAFPGAFWVSQGLVD